MLKGVAGVPAGVVAALGELKDELARVGGTNFAGLVLYGGLARGRYVAGRSDVNVVVLLNDVSAEALRVVAPALRKAWRAIGLDPMLLTPDEVPEAARAFPTKFLDIKQHHVVLVGIDPFKELDVTREQMRLRAEQELCNFLLRLRQRYITAGDDATLIARILARVARPLALELNVLLDLAGKQVPEVDRTAAVFDAAADAFGFDRAVLAGLAELRQATRPSGDVAALYRGVLEILARAVHVAGELKEPLP